MSQAIVTKYIPATNTKGSRVKATSWAGSVTVNYEHGLNADQNHLAAAKSLAEKFGWKGSFVGGDNPDARGYTFVLVQDYCVFEV